ncbi:tumor necrosis factor receptor superfamily member 17 [Corvus hawaiiensis]|uniref:tumor necrosis factor receptor superfamily member 17 n=1 Tax=Corvus hawaiiensis TaxID=134902 RepID=UPI00201991B9|nr:tumor necrosis factor receptor superfamily member 17 [Corvus hawaiiensis]
MELPAFLARSGTATPGGLRARRVSLPAPPPFPGGCGTRSWRERLRRDGKCPGQLPSVQNCTEPDLESGGAEAQGSGGIRAGSAELPVRLWEHTPSHGMQEGTLPYLFSQKWTGCMENSNFEGHDVLDHVLRKAVELGKGLEHKSDEEWLSINTQFIHTLSYCSDSLTWRSSELTCLLLDTIIDLGQISCLINTALGSKTPLTDWINELKLLAMWSGTDSSGILWICLGLGVILILTLFTLMVLFKWKHLKQLKEKLENTDSSAEPNNSLKDNTESSVNTEEIRHTIPSETLMYSVEECTCSDCGLVKPQTGCETSFPLPATEERATVLVTTKSFDYYNYVLGVG